MLFSYALTCRGTGIRGFIYELVYAKTRIENAAFYGKFQILLRYTVQVLKIHVRVKDIKMVLGK